MPLADLQPKLEAFLKIKGGGTRFGPALKEALNVIGDVHHQIGYPPLLMLMSDGGSGDGEPEMVSWTLFISYNILCQIGFQVQKTFTLFLHLRSTFDRALCATPFRMLDCK
jgi:hypothetical protein